MNNPRKMLSFVSIIIAALVGGCSSSGHESGHMNAANISMEPIKVELSWTPDEVSVNEPVTFVAKVTQEDQAVEDAKEVLFEIVNKNDEAQKLEIAGESVGDGVYEAEVTLKNEGEYKVTSHVSARTQHSMPSKELTVLP
ncbi:FixH family protein [Paenibacillus albidus]|uniref:FixH family protein n=1 Tax=Paenibacillus albidus TaxID=2041023 RepID=UPI001BEC3953|nr:FixH family protein [Paenibacillus albidus]MBT2287942.1 FixH family protein [Paenibacillus albidus]